MKFITTFLIFFLFITVCWSQKAQQHDFDFQNAKLSQVLAVIEKQFDVKYSYIDSIVSSKTISLLPKKYTISTINAEIEKVEDIVKIMSNPTG